MGIFNRTPEEKKARAEKRNARRKRNQAEREKRKANGGNFWDNTLATIANTLKFVGPSLLAKWTNRPIIHAVGEAGIETIQFLADGNPNNADQAKEMSAKLSEKLLDNGINHLMRRIELDMEDDTKAIFYLDVLQQIKEEEIFDFLKP